MPLEPVIASAARQSMTSEPVIASEARQSMAAGCVALGCLLFGTQVQADLVDSIRVVKPSIVIVGSYKATNSPRFTLRGTGFVVASDDQPTSHLVITNAHVLPPPGQDDDLASVSVQIQRSKNELEMRKAELIALDAQHDLALLRLEGAAVPALRLGDSARVQEGQSVAFTGFPIGTALGFSPVTHRGVISSIASAALPMPTAQQLNQKAIRGLRAGSFDIFQIDATAYPGNSGGPLFDVESGAVLAVVNMVFIKGTRESALSNPSGISYAIPSQHILPLFQSLPATPTEPRTTR